MNYDQCNDDIVINNHIALYSIIKAITEKKFQGWSNMFLR